MYTQINFKTKKALKEMVAQKGNVAYFQPGPFGGNVPQDGTIYLEGPHFPAAHTWYAVGIAKNGVLVSVK